jgi:AraC-like DNA-binding protein
MFRYQEISPSPRLRDVVSTFWLLEHDGTVCDPQRVVPDGHAELILNWGTPYNYLKGNDWSRQPHCFLAGQLDRPLLLKSDGPAKMLGIGLHPAGAASLIGHPMHELSGRFTPLEELSSALARACDRALDSPDPLAVVEDALLSEYGSSPRRDLLIEEAIRLIAATKGNADLSAVARTVGLSLRQLERRFNVTVGLPPKRFSRIQRFSNVFRRLRDDSRDWAEIAAACGYYDQAHLIRDCKAFAGQTPAILLAQDADLARHFYQRHHVSHSSNTSIPRSR